MREKIIGMVGGVDLPVIRNFQVGYEQGPEDIDEEVESRRFMQATLKTRQRARNAHWPFIPRALT